MAPISCVRCSFTFEVTPELRACPRCGVQKAATCRSCDTPIYVGASTCPAHSAAAPAARTQVRTTAGATMATATRPTGAVLTAPGRYVPSDPCDVCGRGNTVEVTFRSVTGLVVLFQWKRQRGRFCRDCGKRLFDKHMAHCLALGWWGLVSFFVNLYAIAANVMSGNEVKRLDRPLGVTAVRQ